MPLPVTLAGVKLLCGVADTTQDAGITALLALLQPALEYGLDPAVLAYSAGGSPDGAGLLSLLTLGATEALAGAWLGAQGRGLVSQGLLTAQALNTAINALIGDNSGGADFVAQTFKVGTLEIQTKPLFDNFRPEVTKADLVKLGSDLAASGLARLLPFQRSARSLARAAVGGDANLDDQSFVPLLIGAGLGTAGGVGTVGPPPDPTFDAVLGRDGDTTPPGGDDFSSPFLGFTGGAR